MARMTWRKGIDLLIGLIPRICKKYPNVYWIIGGNGDMDPEMQFLVAKHKLEDRVELLGYVNHKNVGSVLNRGHIFLNTSVTEAFCIAALEAASAGLLVVTTNVGGCPEILPEDLLYLAEPNVPALYKMLEKAIADVPKLSPSVNNERVSKFYNWKDIAVRVEKTYYNVLDEPVMTFRERFKRATEVCKLNEN
jgi:phosphatidylinositol N-acetylglucosaminyltransferase subunit A